MGQQIVATAAPGRCCQQDTVLVQSGCVQGARDAQDVGYNMIGGMGRDWHCMRAEDGPNMEVVAPSDPIESLSYSPTRFEVSPTIDLERSQARYSNLVIQSSRARLQRRSKVWEDWLRVATAGRAIELLAGSPDDAQMPQTPKEGEDTSRSSSSVTVKKIAAMYFLDKALTRITILPVEQSNEDASPESPGVHVEIVPVERIQVICTATDFTLFADHVEAHLSVEERKRAVLLQYLQDEPKGHRRRVCFLEASPQDKDRFVQALTALWLEKRSEQSWF